MSELLQQVRVLDPVSGTDRIADVLIADGVIQAIAPQLYGNCRGAVSPPVSLPHNTLVRDCQGLVLGPGLVDLYSHSGEPGFEERETLASLMLAARAGGFTRLAILPNTTPPADNPAGLALLQSKARLAADYATDVTDVLSVKPTDKPSASSATKSAAHHPQLYFWGALTMGVSGQQMTELTELARAGVVGFNDGQPLQNLALLRRLLEYLQPLGKPVAIWPCDLKLAAGGVMREGLDSLRLGLRGNPAIAETAALAALLEIVAAVGTPVHIMRVSTSRSVGLIQEAKARGLPVTASTTWMHLLLNTQNVGGGGAEGQGGETPPLLLLPYDPSMRLEPPLGNPGDQLALIQGVREGVIDAIAIDHTPYTYEEKTVAFAEAPAGAIGLELALPLLWQNLVKFDKLSHLELWRALSTQPALCLKQTPAAIAPGQPAELTLFDPQVPWQCGANTLKSLSTNTPWLGQQLTGRVVQTFPMM